MAYKDFNLGDLLSESTGLDSFLGDTEPQHITASVTPNRMVVTDIDQIKGFSRVASDTLVRKAERDLWSVQQTDDGEWVIERLFDDDGNPLTV